MTKNNPIVIAGAGISGLTAAINLKKAGFPVRVYERAGQSGLRFNGDFQGLQNWGPWNENVLNFLRRINIKIDFLYKPIYQFSLVGSDLNETKVNLRKPIVYLVERGVGQRSLDTRLSQQALDCGVEIIYNHAYRENKTRADIVATGPIIDCVTDGMAAGYVFNTNLEDEVIVILNNKTAPNGYSYLLVINGRATLATCIFDGFKNISNFLAETLKIYQKLRDFRMKNAHRFAGIGNFFLPRKLTMDKKIYIGEAGGFQGMTAGFGMRLAILTGHLSAESIIKNKNYNQLIKEAKIMEYLKLSVSNRFIYQLLGWRDYNFLINRIGKIEHPFDFINRQNSEFSLVKKIIYPLAKFTLRRKNRDYRKIN